jgi:hypothetical protein
MVKEKDAPARSKALSMNGVVLSAKSEGVLKNIPRVLMSNRS